MNLPIGGTCCIDRPQMIGFDVAGRESSHRCSKRLTDTRNKSSIARGIVNQVLVEILGSLQGLIGGMFSSISFTFLCRR
jgi:hypothetical protein